MSKISELPFFESLVLEAGALNQVAPFLVKHGSKRLVLAADGNTYEAAGRDLELMLREAGLEVTLCLLEPAGTGDVVADEAAIVQLLLAIEPGLTDALIAAGSGTIHDIVRFAGHRSGIPFISVPTAPSVDGFTSAGAPLIIRGIKKTVPAVPPTAIFADLNILMKAPQSLVAAGFGDMLGKYTSLFDWKFSRLTAGEPYNEQAALITERALNSCVKHAREIGQRTEEGITVLMTALIESGIAMLLFGQSHPPPAPNTISPITGRWNFCAGVTGRCCTARRSAWPAPRSRACIMPPSTAACIRPASRKRCCSTASRFAPGSRTCRPTPRFANCSGRPAARPAWRSLASTTSCSHAA